MPITCSMFYGLNSPLYPSHLHGERLMACLSATQLYSLSWTLSAKPRTQNPNCRPFLFIKYSNRTIRYGPNSIHSPSRAPVGSSSCVSTATDVSEKSPTIRELCDGHVPDHILRRVEEVGYTVPTDVQRQALPILFSGRDCILHAQTGSGKTLAYLLSIFSVVNTKRSAVQALIVVPTRELGTQVTKVARMLAAKPAELGMEACSIMALLDGGMLGRQKSWLKSEPPTIVVATLGSLCQMLEKKFLKLESMRVLVIDEVDFMFNSSKQVSSLRKLLLSYSSCSKRQTIFASASIPQHKRFVYDCIQHKWTKADAVHVHVNPVEPMPSRLRHRFVICGKDERHQALLSLLKSDMPQSAIIFVSEQSEKSKRAGHTPPTTLLIEFLKTSYTGCSDILLLEEDMNFNVRAASFSVSIAANSASKEKTQAHIRELEEEVNLLKNLSHPNIVRYLGTAREEESLNILLEFVPGGSISSLLGKFGSFPESVIRMYTKQLLLGLDYLHRNGIMHRDIKGANILVDNKGCIKLADFGASKKVVELATMTGAKSMKGTPYWMAPEVILQTGHSFSADIWSVGCTVIEMATGKPPWSQQYQEVAALFHIGTTKSHPPIPDHLSVEAKDFLLKCLQKEPNFRAAAAVLLQHPFVMGQYQETEPVSRASVMGGVTENSGKRMATPEMEFKTSTTYTRLNDVHNSVRCSTIYPDKFSRNSPLWASNNRDDDMCQMDDDIVFGSSTKFDSPLLSDDFNKSFNPMSEPNDDWPCKFDGSPEIDKSGVNSFSGRTVNKAADSTVASCNVDNDFTFPSELSVAEDDDDVTETKIIAFLEEKAIDLKKLQTPLYEEFYNSLNASCSPNALGTENKENVSNNLYLPPKSRSPKRVSSRRFSAAIDVAYTASSGSQSQDLSNIDDQTLPQVQQPKPSEWKERMIDAQQELISPSASFSERQRRWEEELYEELERKREMMRQAGVAKTPSPKDRIVNRQKDRSRFAFLGK